MGGKEQEDKGRGSTWSTAVLENGRVEDGGGVPRLGTRGRKPRLPLVVPGAAWRRRRRRGGGGPRHS